MSAPGRQTAIDRSKHSQRHVHHTLFFFGDFADGDHFAGVAEKTVDDARDIDIQNVSLLERDFIGDAVADDFVQRCADRFGKRRLAIVKRSGDGVMFPMEFERELIKL